MKNSFTSNLLIFTFLFSFFSLFSQQNNPLLVNGNDKVSIKNSSEAQKIIKNKIPETKDILSHIDQQFSEIDKLLASNAIELSDSEIEELNKLKSMVQNTPGQFYKNFFMILKIKNFSIWIHIDYPPKMLVLNPITPLNEGILISKLIL